MNLIRSILFFCVIVSFIILFSIPQHISLTKFAQSRFSRIKTSKLPTYKVYSQLFKKDISHLLNMVKRDTIKPSFSIFAFLKSKFPKDTLVGFVYFFEKIVYVVSLLVYVSSLTKFISLFSTFVNYFSIFSFIQNIFIAIFFDFKYYRYILIQEHFVLNQTPGTV